MGKRKVGVIQHPDFDVKVNLTLDSDSMEFEARWEQQTFVSKDGEEVRDKMLKWIESQMSIQWEPVIRVVALHDNAQSDQIQATAAIAVAVERFWVGRVSQGDHRSVKWQDEAPRGLAGQRFQPPYGGGPRGSRPDHAEEFKRMREFKLPYRGRRDSWTPVNVFLAYTPELWAGLQQVEAQIMKARELLEEMLGSEEGFTKVAQLGATLLPNLLNAGPTDGN